MGRLKTLLAGALLWLCAMPAMAACPTTSSGAGNKADCPSPLYLRIHGFDGVWLGSFVSGAWPSSPVAGQIIWDSTVGGLRRYSGSAWVQITGLGGGTVTGTPSTVGYVPTWGNTGGTALGAGFPAATSGANTLLMTGSGGTILPGVLPLATPSAVGAVKGDGTTISCTGGVCTSLVTGGSASSLANLIDTYHADPTGTTDSTTALQSAASSGKTVIIPSGTYKISGTIPVASNTSLVGFGPGSTKITSTSTSGAMFSLANGVTDVQIGGFTCTRSVTPATGASCIATARSGALDDVERVSITNMTISSQYDGLDLGPTNWSAIQDVILENNTHDGWIMRNTAGTSGAGSNPLQWTMRHVIGQFNNGRCGEVVGVSQTKTPAPHLSVGEWINLSCFANTAGGLGVFGSTSAPIASIRLGGSNFLGADGAGGEFFLDSYSQNHTLEFAGELAGVLPTGIGLATPAANAGYGLFVSQNNSMVSAKVTLNGNSHDGLYTAANLYGAATGPVMVTSGSWITNNGLALTSGARNGVTLASGNGGLVVSGSYIGCWNYNPGACPQQYGANIGVDKIAITVTPMLLNSVGKTFLGGGVTLTSNSYLDPLAGGSSGGTGTVTSVATSGCLTGGPITGSGTLGVTAGCMLATAANDNAASGYMGEMIASSVPSSSGVSLSAGTTANVTSISLPAGDWEVCGSVGFLPASTTVITQVFGGVGTTSATIPADPGAGARFVMQNSSGLTTGGVIQFPTGCTRLSLPSTTSAYLTALSGFTTSTNAAFGYLRARRAR